MPLFKKPYEIPYKTISEVDKELEEPVANGLWTPVNYREWALPLVVVPRKGNKLILCLSYRPTVKPNIFRDMYPLPRIDDILVSFSGGKVFCVFDLMSAFKQLEPSEASKQLLTVNSHRELFITYRLPFGMASAPAIFQSVKDAILGKIEGVCCYLGDLIISGENLKDSETGLRVVLKKLDEFNVRT